MIPPYLYQIAFVLLLFPPEKEELFPKSHPKMKRVINVFNCDCMRKIAQRKQWKVTSTEANLPSLSTHFGR